MPPTIPKRPPFFVPRPATTSSSSNQDLQKTFSDVPPDELEKLAKQFSELCTGSTQGIPKTEAIRVLQSEGQSYDDVRERLKHLGGSNRTIDLREWVEVRATIFHLHGCSLPTQLHTGQGQKSHALSTQAGKVTVRGSTANVSHTINEDERTEFTNHINLVRAHPPSSALFRCSPLTSADHRERPRDWIALPDPDDDNADL